MAWSQQSCATRSVFVVALLLAAHLPFTGGVEDLSAAGSRVLMATTTSMANTGLLDTLLTAFENETGIDVDFVAVGTGAALKLGENGDVDLVLVHAPPAEERFVREGYGLERVPVMVNDFVIVGPPGDPASVAACSTAVEAFRRIAGQPGALFLSRGDSSGTHRKEMAVWRQAGIAPRGSRYIETGSGMGACLQMADEKRAYTLTDRGTYLARLQQLSIRILLEGDPALLNPYALIAVAPERRPGGNHEGAKRLITWMTSPEGQERIGRFRINGEPLFHPAAGDGGGR